MDAPLSAYLAARRATAVDRKQPFVSLSYAQAIDGSIAFQRGFPYPISGQASLALTHNLRAHHDAILVGIGTVLADNPQLNVRLVKGEDPQPIILDSRLRTPPDCKLVKGVKPAWIATTHSAASQRAKALVEAGVRLFYYPQGTHNQIPLEALLNDLFKAGIQSLMVEGGAEVIHSFVNANLTDWMMITIAPQFLGGLPVWGDVNNLRLDHPIHLENPSWGQFGEDMVVWGRPRRVSQ